MITAHSYTSGSKTDIERTLAVGEKDKFYGSVQTVLLSYRKALRAAEVETLKHRRDVLCRSFFRNMLKADRKLHTLLPSLATDHMP